MKRFLKSSRMLVSVIALFSLFTLTFAPVVGAAVDTKSQAQQGVQKAGGTGKGNSANDVTAVIKSVIGIISFLVGLVAVLMIVIAGFRFVTSNGDSNTIASARNTIIYAVIGIVITVMAYAIVNFVLDNITT